MENIRDCCLWCIKGSKVIGYLFFGNGVRLCCNEDLKRRWGCFLWRHNIIQLVHCGELILEMLDHVCIESDGHVKIPVKESTYFWCCVSCWAKWHRFCIGHGNICSICNRLANYLCHQHPHVHKRGRCSSIFHSSKIEVREQVRIETRTTYKGWDWKGAFLDHIWRLCGIYRHWVTGRLRIGGVG